MLIPRIFQIFDSALPIGSFNYSSGIEETYYRGYNIEDFIYTVFNNVILKEDTVAVIKSFKDPYYMDELVYASKLTNELREMTTNMGRSLASLDLCQDDFIRNVKEGKTYGTYPVVVARICKCLGISEDDCAIGLTYSEASLLVFSAVRLGAISYYRGQEILSTLLNRIEIHEEFEPFDPILDILSKSHVKREPKVLMS